MKQTRVCSNGANGTGFGYNIVLMPQYKVDDKVQNEEFWRADAISKKLVEMLQSWKCGKSSVSVWSGWDPGVIL